MKGVRTKRLERAALKETRLGAAMKRTWLAKLKKRLRGLPAAKPESQKETVEQGAVGEVETVAQKAAEGIFARHDRASYGGAEVSFESSKQSQTASSFHQEFDVLREVSSSSSIIKSRPAGSVKTVSRSIKTVEPEAQLPRPQERDNIFAESVPSVSQAKRFHQTAAAVRASKTGTKLAGRAAKAAAAAVKEAVSLLIAGGWVSVVVIVLVCGIALAGAFLSGQDRDVNWQSIGPFEWPLPQDFTITSPFGERVDPITGEVSFHTGTDIAAPEGTPILAAADGVVMIANSANPRYSYGYYIKLQHEDGFETLYVHCSALCVAAGQEVQQGEVIGFVGSTGDSTGNHLHFEVREDGMRVDAMKYFAAI